MVSVAYRNSGTTAFSQACPVLADLWRANGSPFGPSTRPVGHQWVITTDYDHDPNCCSIREIGTAPGPIGPLWPFDAAANQPPTVDFHDQALRAFLDALGHRCTLDDAWARTRLAAIAAGITDRAFAELGLTAAYRQTLARMGRVEEHNCGTTHRTPRQVALCAYANDYSQPKVTGKGRWAVVSFCAKPTVTLWPSQWVAVRALRRLDDYGCGRRCRDRHTIRELRTPTLVPTGPSQPHRSAG